MSRVIYYVIYACVVMKPTHTTRVIRDEDGIGINQMVHGDTVIQVMQFNNKAHALSFKKFAGRHSKLDSIIMENSNRINFNPNPMTADSKIWMNGDCPDTIYVRSDSGVTKFYRVKLAKK